MSWSIWSGSRLATSSLFACIILFSVNSIYANESPSETVNFYLIEGNNSFNLTNYVEAISFYDKAIEIEPNHIAALAKKGESLAKLERFEEAISIFNKVIEIEPRYGDKYGTLYLDKLLQLDPKNIEALFIKGKSLSIYNDTLEEAISYFDKVIEINPNHANALYYNGEVYFQLDDFEKAVFFYDKSLEIEPNHVGALSGKGYALAKLDDFEKSDTYFDRALKLEPDNVETLYKRGSAFLVQGNADKALSYFYDALKINPNHFQSELKLKIAAKGVYYKNLDGFVEAKIYDSNGYLVGHLQVQNLYNVNHNIFNKTIDEWPLKQMINRNGQDYEVRQLEEEIFPTYRFLYGGAHRYGIYFPQPNSEFGLIEGSYWQFLTDKGDVVKIVRTVFRPI